MIREKRLSTLEFSAERLGFSAAHFTIFSANSRERFHGHNYRLILKLTAELGEDGILFDYAIYNRKLSELCQNLDSYFLLPTKSPFLRIEEVDQYYYIYFHDEKIPFLKKDVKLLPITNTTLEELSQWFLNNLLADEIQLRNFRIQGLTVKLSNGPGQAGLAYWSQG